MLDRGPTTISLISPRRVEFAQTLDSSPIVTSDEVRTGRHEDALLDCGRWPSNGSIILRSWKAPKTKTKPPEIDPPPGGTLDVFERAFPQTA